MKISGSMVVYNEADNIEMALLSTKDFCNEMIIVDDYSDDGTPNIIKKVCKREGIKYKLIYPKKEDRGKIYETRSLSLKNCTGDWILVVDGDFIFHTSGTNNIQNILKEIKGKENMNINLYFPMVFLYGDYWHTIIHRPIGIPHPYFIKNTNSLICKRDNRFFKYQSNTPIIKQQTSTMYGFHAGGVKTPRMLLYRRYWTEWRELNRFDLYPDCWDYVKSKVGDNIEEKSKIYFRDYMKSYIPYDSKRYCYYPAILKEKMNRNGNYKMLYENGKIVGRSDVGKVIDLPGKFTI